MTLYLATCPKCRTVHELIENHAPPAAEFCGHCSGAGPGILVWTRVPDWSDPPGPHKTTDEIADEILKGTQQSISEIEKLKAELKELDKLNGDLHEQLRDRDRHIYRLEEELKSRPGVDRARDDEVQRIRAQVKEANDRAEHNLGTARTHRIKLETYDREFARLQAHIDRQDRMLDNSATMLNVGATMIDAAHVEVGRLHEQLQAAEAALAEARSQRDYNAKSIDKLSQELDLAKVTETQILNAYKKLKDKS